MGVANIIMTRARTIKAERKFGIANGIAPAWVYVVAAPRTYLD